MMPFVTNLNWQPEQKRRIAVKKRECIFANFKLITIPFKNGFQSDVFLRK